MGRISKAPLTPDNLKEQDEPRPRPSVEYVGPTSSDVPSTGAFSELATSGASRDAQALDGGATEAPRIFYYAEDGGVRLQGGPLDDPDAQAETEGNAEIVVFPPPYNRY